MKITLDDAAVQVLSKRLGDSKGQIRLVHDTEGCGCIVNAVPALHIINEQDPREERIENDLYPFWIDPKQIVFYEEQLILKGDTRLNTFRLDSHSQFYGLNIQLVDTR